MMMNGRTIAGALLTAALGSVVVGCGGNGSDEAKPAAPTASPSVQTTMVDVCPQVEASLPADIMVPTRKQLRAIQADIEEIRADADLESDNALKLLLAGLADAEAAFDSEEIMPALEVSEKFDGAIGAFADRCEAAGSSALQ